MSTTKNLYAQMMRSEEIARERNKREQRRLQVHLDQRHGPEFAARYRVRELNREQRIIGKELDRIRKGIHKPLTHEYVASSPVEKKTVFSFSDLSSAVIYTEEEINLYRTMVFMQNNPSALVPIVDAHSHSRAYFETLQRVTPGITPSPRDTFVPHYMKRFKGLEIPEEKNPLVTKYSSLLYRQSQVLRKANRVISVKLSSSGGQALNVAKVSESLHVSSPKSQPTDRGNGGFGFQIVDDINHKENGESENLKESANKKVTNGNGSRPDNANEISKVRIVSISLNPKEEDDNHPEALGMEEQGTGVTLPKNMSPMVSANRFRHEVLSTSTPTPGRPRQPLDLLTLSDNGVQSARESVVKRLAVNKDMTSVGKSGIERKTSIANKGVGDESNENTEDSKSKPLTATKALAMFPTYDPEVYNADGSLRKVHQLPDFDESYQQARKARYVRSKEHLERERELGIKEIFDKS